MFELALVDKKENSARKICGILLLKMYQQQKHSSSEFLVFPGTVLVGAPRWLPPAQHQGVSAPPHSRVPPLCCSFPSWFCHSIEDVTEYQIYPNLAHVNWNSKFGNWVGPVGSGIQKDLGGEKISAAAQSWWIMTELLVHMERHHGKRSCYQWEQLQHPHWHCVLLPSLLLCQMLSQHREILLFFFFFLKTSMWSPKII